MMTTNFTWSVVLLEAYPEAEGQTNVVFQVYWNCFGQNGDFSYRTYSQTPVSYVAGTPYTPYADLTQDQVLGWIWSSGVDKDAVEASIEEQIQNQMNPTVVTPPLPWNQGV